MVPGFDQPQMTIRFPDLDGGLPFKTGTPVGHHVPAGARLDFHLGGEPPRDLVRFGQRPPDLLYGRIDFDAILMLANSLGFIHICFTPIERKPGLPAPLW
jgi:hypothetical protein